MVLSYDLFPLSVAQVQYSTPSCRFRLVVQCAGGIAARPHE